MGDPELPEGYEVDEVTDDDLAPEGHPDHDCDGAGDE